MAFEDKIKELAVKVSRLSPTTATEEAAKQAFVLPLLDALGYDVFNPEEVIPEYSADVGIKKGERVDYAIIKDGVPIILIECKAAGASLTVENASQLYRYYAAKKTPVAILTNGVVYKFFSDLEEQNKLDQRPFFEFNFLDLPDAVPSQLEQFCKDKFETVSVLNAAAELKYTKEIKAIFVNQLAQAEDDFVKFIGAKAGVIRLKQNRKEQFPRIVSQALAQFVDDQIRERLRLNKPAPIPIPTETEGEPPVPVKSDLIQTTSEELEVYQIVRAVLRQNVDARRIAYRDTQSYFSVLLDDSKFKPLCRFKAGEKSKNFAYFDGKETVWKKIDQIEEIFGFSDFLIATLKRYEAGDETKEG